MQIAASTILRRAQEAPGLTGIARLPGQNLNDADVGAALEQMGSKAVPQDGHAHPLVETGSRNCRAAGRMQVMQDSGWDRLSRQRPENSQ